MRRHTVHVQDTLRDQRATPWSSRRRSKILPNQKETPILFFLSIYPFFFLFLDKPFTRCLHHVQVEHLIGTPRQSHPSRLRVFFFYFPTTKRAPTSNVLTFSCIYTSLPPCSESLDHGTRGGKDFARNRPDRFFPWCESPREPYRVCMCVCARGIGCRSRRRENGCIGAPLLNACCSLCATVRKSRFSGTRASRHASFEYHAPVRLQRTRLLRLLIVDVENPLFAYRIIRSWPELKKIFY